MRFRAAAFGLLPALVAFQAASQPATEFPTRPVALVADRAFPAAVDA